MPPAHPDRSPIQPYQQQLRPVFYGRSVLHLCRCIGQIFQAKAMVHTINEMYLRADAVLGQISNKGHHSPQRPVLIAENKKGYAKQLQGELLRIVFVFDKPDHADRAVTEPLITPHVSFQDKVLHFCRIPHSRKEVAEYCGYKDLKHFTERADPPFPERRRPQSFISALPDTPPGTLPAHGSPLPRPSRHTGNATAHK